MIYVVPESGLCNRMRVIDSAIRLARYRGTRVTVFWKINADVGAGFYELFAPSESSWLKTVNVINLEGYGYYDKPFTAYFTGVRKLFKPKEITVNEIADSEITRIYDSIAEEFFAGNDSFGWYEQEIRNYWDVHWPGKRIYINSYARFFGPVLSDYGFFSPATAISAKLQKLTAAFAGHTIGVHIRRKDNAHSIAVSTTQKFMDQLDEEIGKHPDCKIFLATDDEDEKLIFGERYGGRLILPESELRRDNAGGMKDAVLELYALASCKKIIGSYYSSFTEVAVSLKELKEYKIIR